MRLSYAFAPLLILFFIGIFLSIVTDNLSLLGGCLVGIFGVISITVLSVHSQGQMEAAAAELEVLEQRTLEYSAHDKYLRNRQKVLWLGKIDSLVTGLQKLQSNPWYKRLGTTRKVNSLLSRAESIKRFLDGYLVEFVKLETERRRSFFQSAQLNDEQTFAIMMSDAHNLIVAAAGSGKTRTLTARVALLVERGVPSEKILALAYTNDAADEMSKRLSNQYGISGANVMTLHSFSRSLARQSINFRSGVASRERQGEFIRMGAEKLASQNRDFAARLLTFAVELKEAEERTQSEFPTVAHYYEYLRKQEYETLSRKKLKSIAERDIGNFLFLNGVKFEYESPLEWAERSVERRGYQPDFFLPDYNLWLEHWAIDREGNVPEWFSKGGAVSPSDRYRQGMEYKRRQFNEHNQKLIETFHYQWAEGTLVESLTRQLEANGVTLKPMSIEEVLARIDKLIRRDPLYELMFSFITKGKTGGLGVKDLEARLSGGSKGWTRRQKSFASLMIPIWREYETSLRENNMLDFSDMITLALQVARQNGGDLARQYTHVLIDEFQDITDPQLGLIQCLTQDSSDENTLYCVGDHRQNIFSFAGSNVYNIIDFDQRFLLPEKATLSANHRCPTNIVQASNQVMAAGSYKDKPAVPALNSSYPIRLVEKNDSSRYEKWEADKAKELLKSILETKKSNEEVMVLARYNFRLEPLRMAFPDQRNQRLSFHSIHAAKGREADYVLVLGCISGEFGFPSRVVEENLLDVVNVRKQDKKEKLEEERRLFYVALTRCRKQLFLFTSRTDRSQFLFEIADFVGLAPPQKDVATRRQIRSFQTSPNRGQVAGKNKAYTVEAVRAKYPQAYVKWDPTEDQALTKEFRENLDIESIAKRHGRRPGAIRARLQRLGLLPPSPGGNTMIHDS